MNIYREVVAYINSHKPGTSFTTKDFHKHMASLGYRDTYQPHYRINTYRTYLRSAGFVYQIGRGVWMTVYVIPEWVTLSMLETARGYGRGCNKVVQREAQDEIAAYFAYRKSIKKTNIQENVSPAQKDSVDLHHTKTQTTMAKPTSLPVSPAFIVEAHRVACNDWKAKLEGMYPSVFQPTQTFKIGDKIQFPASTAFSNATYILADAGKRHMVLINLQTGGRWTGQVVVENPNAITSEEMAKICYGQKLDTILVNGTTPTKATKWSKEKTLTAKVSDILAAYKATSEMTTKNMIKGYFPEAFGQYVKFIESSSQTVTLSSYVTTIDGEDFIIGRGMASRPELEGACIGFLTDKIEVEVIKEGDKTWVAFKKK